MRLCLFFCLFVLVFSGSVHAGDPWKKMSDGPWGSREGLMASVVTAPNGTDVIVMSGGRGTFGIGFFNDVWRTVDGTTWEHLPNGPYGKRAYHIMLNWNNCIILMGGQTFTTFYNDVWQSCDAGATWTEVLKQGTAPWDGRAGLAATVHNKTIVLAGGCYDKNGNPLARSFYSDVWSSTDGGKTWTEQTSSPAWSGRSGPRLISFNSKLYLVAGERGFTDDTQLAGVYSSSDGGANWDLVTKTPGYSARSGHGLVVDELSNRMIVVAGWPELHDIWQTVDGVQWKQTSDLVWGCNSTDCGKFDFWPVIHQGRLYTLGGSGATSTFGKLYSDTWSAALSDI